MNKFFTGYFAGAIMASAFFIVGSCSAHAAETFDGRTYYWGDLHAHTGVSGDGSAYEDGDCPSCGTLSGVFDTAKANGLDFVALTDHNNNSLAADFNAMLVRCRSATTSSFICIPSTEMSALRSSDGAKYGHKNLYIFQDDDAKLQTLDLTDLPSPRIKTGQCSTDTYSTAASAAYAFGPTLFWAHHETATAVTTTDWSCHSDTYEPVVEVYSGWGDFLTYPSSYDPPSTADNNTGDVSPSVASVHAALDRGLKVGFVAGTDEHETTPGSVCSAQTRGPKPYGGGVTGISVPTGTSFKRSSLYYELVAKHSMATTGPRIPMSVTWTTASQTYGPGDTVTMKAGTPIIVTVKVPAAYASQVTTVSMIGSTTSTQLSAGSAGTWSATLTTLPSWLYAQAQVTGSSSCVDGGTDTREFLWSSPTWFMAQ